MERESEVELVQTQLRTLSAHACQAAGVSLLHLVLDGSSMDTFGHTVFTLSHRTRPELPSHNFATGDVVQLKVTAGSSGGDDSQDFVAFGGVVSRVKDESISLTVDDFEEKCGNLSVGSVLDGLRNSKGNRLDLLPNDATYRRMEAAIEEMAKARDNSLVDVLFGSRPPRFEAAPVSHFCPFNMNLNQGQRDAVMAALEARDVVLIHGPPGIV